MKTFIILLFALPLFLKSQSINDSTSIVLTNFSEKMQTAMITKTIGLSAVVGGSLMIKQGYSSAGYFFGGAGLLFLLAGTIEQYTAYNDLKKINLYLGSNQIGLRVKF